MHIHAVDYLALDGDLDGYRLDILLRVVFQHDVYVFELMFWEASTESLTLTVGTLITFSSVSKITTSGFSLSPTCDLLRLMLLDEFV